MASSVSKAFGSGILLLLMMQIIAPDVVAVDVPDRTRVRVMLGNNMTTFGQRLDVQCRLRNPSGSEYKTYNKLSLMPNEAYEWTMLNNDTDIFACTFSTVGKQYIHIDVVALPQSDSCNCVEPSRCYWQALDAGLWCNSSFEVKWIPSS